MSKYYRVLLGSKNAFIITVKTDNAGTSGTNQFTIPTIGSGYNYNIQTSDGQEITGNNGNKTITFPTAGTYDVKIKGNFPRIYFYNAEDRLKLIDIKSWGTIFWTSMENAFFGCNNLTTLTATDAPNLTNTTSFASMFNSCRNLLKVEANFWDVSNIDSMVSMFRDCSVLNYLGVDNWDTSKVTNFQEMFNRAYSINPEIENWNTSSLAIASSMFKQNSTINRSFANWDITKVTSFAGFNTSGNGMSVANYDATLIGWANQLVKTGVSLDFGNSKYTLGGSAAAARQILISTYGWTIVDGGGI
jgi:surface protein